MYFFVRKYDSPVVLPTLKNTRFVQLLIYLCDICFFIALTVLIPNLIGLVIVRQGWAVSASWFCWIIENIEFINGVTNIVLLSLIMVLLLTIWRIDTRMPKERKVRFFGITALMQCVYIISVILCLNKVFGLAYQFCFVSGLVLALLCIICGYQIWAFWGRPLYKGCFFYSLGIVATTVFSHHIYAGSLTVKEGMIPFMGFLPFFFYTAFTGFIPDDKSTCEGLLVDVLHESKS